MRLFLAVDLPEVLRRDVAKAQGRLDSVVRGWRWVRPEGIHLTVRFLGEVSPEADAAMRERWRRTARRCAPVRLRVGGVGVFPSPRRPRVLWIGVDEIAPPAGFRDLAAAYERTAVDLGFSPERRGVHAHLTLARARPGGRPEAPEADAVGHLGEMRADEVVLFRSRLSPRGASYEKIDVFPLAG